MKTLRALVFVLASCGARTPVSSGVRAMDAALDTSAPPSDASVARPGCKPGDAPLVLATGEADAIALDQTHVYWSGPDGVLRTPKSGGPIEKLGGARSVISIAVDATHVFFANRESGSIARVPKSGGTAETLAQNQLELWSIAIDDTFVYWGASAGVDHVYRRTKQGTMEDVLDSFGGVPISVALSRDEIVYTTGMTGTVRAQPKSGGSPRVLVNNENMIWDIAAAGDFAYITSLGERGMRGPRVLRISLKTQMGPVPLASDLSYPYGIATDGSFVYFTDRIAKNVRKVSVNGGPVTTIYSTTDLPWDVVVDEMCAYVSLDQPGAVIRIPK
jgi:hypothetical protein